MVKRKASERQGDSRVEKAACLLKISRPKTPALYGCWPLVPRCWRRRCSTYVVILSLGRSSSMHSTQRVQRLSASAVAVDRAEVAAFHWRCRCPRETVVFCTLHSTSVRDVVIVPMELNWGSTTLPVSFTLVCIAWNILAILFTYSLFVMSEWSHIITFLPSYVSAPLATKRLTKIVGD